MAWIVYLLSFAYSGTITDLDNDRFDKRELATRYLQEQWPLCVPSLYIKSKPSPEFVFRRSRINKKSIFFFNVTSWKWISGKIIDCVADDPKELPDLSEIDLNTIDYVIPYNKLWADLRDYHEFRYHYYFNPQWRIYIGHTEEHCKNLLIQEARDKYRSIVEKW